MQESTVQIYKILISAPSDMVKFTQTIKDAINEYNSGFGVANGTFFTTCDWKHDTIPSYGASAQSKINEQIVDSADAVIALFGARFGSPTEEYESGTIEEIEHSYKSGKEVLTYFATGKNFDLDKIDIEQLQKVRAFKENYRGLYKEFKTQAALKSELQQALPMLAQKLQLNNAKGVAIYSLEDGDIVDRLVFEQYDFCNVPDCIERKRRIDDLINKLNAIHCRKIEKQVSTTSQNNPVMFPELQAAIQNVSVICNTISKREEIIYDRDYISLIKRYAETNGFSLSDDFFEIGDACLRGNNLTGYDYSGTTDEIQKSKGLMALTGQIREYNLYKRFYAQFEGLYFLPLVIKNESNIFAEDICIKLEYDEEAYFDPYTITVHSQDVGEKLKDFLDVFDERDNVDIENMEWNHTTYPIFPLIPNPITHAKPIPPLSYYKEYMKAKVEEIYPYIVNKRGKKVVLKFDLTNGLRQFTAQFLCAKLMLRKEIQEIKYTITSKSFGHEIKGIIKK